MLGLGRNMADALLDQPEEWQHGCSRLVVPLDDLPGLWFE
jgi:hypothetical protein